MLGYLNISELNDDINKKESWLRLCKNMVVQNTLYKNKLFIFCIFVGLGDILVKWFEVVQTDISENHSNESLLWMEIYLLNSGCNTKDVGFVQYILQQQDL